MSNGNGKGINWAAVAQGGIVALLAWCLYTAHNIEVLTVGIEERTERMEERMLSWHTDVGSNDTQATEYQSVTYDPAVESYCLQEASSGWGWALVECSDDSVPDEVKLAGQYRSSLSCDQRLEFSQRSMVRAYNSIKAHGYDSALKALLIGLEDSGWVCREEGERLQCNKGG